MATYTINGKSYKIPDSVQGDKLEETLLLLSEQTTAQPAAQAEEMSAEEVSQPTATQEPTIGQRIGKVPGIAQAAEFAGAANRSILDFADFLGPDTVNAILSTAGSDYRVPTFTQLGQKVGIGDQGFVEPGLQRDILQAAGAAAPAAMGIQGVIRQAAKNFMPSTQQAVTTGQRILSQAAEQSVPAAGAYGAVSGAGAEVGERVGGPVGAAVGAIAAPTVVQGVGALLKSGTKAGFGAIKNAFARDQAFNRLSEKAKSELLAEEMVRAGMSIDDVTRRLTELGDDAILADVAPGFAGLLRDAANKIPRIQGRITKELSGRQTTQAGRIASALDDATGTPSLTLDDEIARIESITKPEITRLYAAVKGKPMEFSPQVKGILEKSETIRAARREANKALNDMRLLGEEPTNIDTVDQLKKALDDQVNAAIRAGENEKASRTRDAARRIPNAAPGGKRLSSWDSADFSVEGCPSSPLRSSVLRVP